MLSVRCANREGSVTNVIFEPLTARLVRELQAKDVLVEVACRFDVTHRVGQKSDGLYHNVRSGQRPKLSDPAHGTQRLQPERDGRVSAWLGGIISSLQSHGALLAVWIIKAQRFPLRVCDDPRVSQKCPDVGAFPRLELAVKLTLPVVIE